MSARLAELPDDILFYIFASVQTARDLRALALSCRRLHHLVTDDAWRIFVRNRFPSLVLPNPANGSQTWRELAESLTWQSRCWDRRSLQFNALIPHFEHRRDQRSYNRALYMAMVDTHYDPTTQEEVVIWGAGEDIVARYRERQGRGKPSKTTWKKQEGRELSFKVGYDDITSIKFVKQNGKRAMLTGRHNGQLNLLSAEPDNFAETITNLSPTLPSDTETPQSVILETINSLDLFETDNKRLLAVGAKSKLRVYDLNQIENGADMTAPTTIYDLDEVTNSRAGRLGNAKWMENGKTLALALVGCTDTLRYLSLTPTGWTHHVAAKNERVEEEFNIKYDRTICPNSLEPVYLHSGAGRGTSMLLSSWRDGTIRLQDLRTPSPFDAIYQDNVDPWSNAEALMAYGTERFIAGGGDGLTIQVFDFRWPKNYYHTTALPCFDKPPFPRPHQPFITKPSNSSTNPRRAHCDYLKNLPCTYHSLANTLYYRPNAKFFLSESLRAFRTTSVWSMARGSDVSPNFYVGISGGVIEASLEQTPATCPYPTTTMEAPVVDPNFGLDDWRASAPAASGYRTRPLVPALMETGDGYSFKGNDRSIMLPGLVQYQGPREWAGRPLAEEQRRLVRHHRLDVGYQHEVDFLDCLN